MKRIMLLGTLSVLFVLSHYVFAKIWANFELLPVWIPYILDYLVLVSMPIMMIVAIPIVPRLRTAAIASILITTSFLIIDITNFSGRLAGYALIMLIISNIVLFVASLHIPEEFYFGRRAGLYFSILSGVYFLRYTPIIGVVFAVIDDYYQALGQDWGRYWYTYLLYEGFYIATFIFSLLALYNILVEKEEIGY